MIRRGTWLTLALLAVLLIAALPVVSYPLGRDQGEFAVIGRGLLQGDRPYVDLWNPKPPAIFVVYAAVIAVAGPLVTSLRALDLLLLVLVAPPLIGIGRRIGGGRSGLWAVVLLALVYFTESFWTLTQNDGIALIPMIWAVYAALRAGRGSPGWAALSGALCGLAVWFKYPFALIGVAVIAAYWLASAGDRRGLVGRAGAALAGGALVIAVGAAWLMAVGAWEAFIESAVVTAQYTALGASESGNLFAEGAAARLTQWIGLIALLPLTALLARRADRGGLAVLLIWLGCGLAMMGVQLKGYDYHWLPALPPLALLAGIGADRGIGWIVGRVGRGRAGLLHGAAIALAVVWLAARLWGGLLPYLDGRSDALTYAAGFVAGDFRADDSLRMAEALRARTVPGDSLFIWGFRPEVYFMAGLNPAVRFLFNFPLIADWYPADWRVETVETLWAALPPVVLVLEADYLPWVTGRDEDSHTLLLEYTDLRSWLEYNYVREPDRIGPFLVWRRSPPTTP